MFVLLCFNLFKLYIFYSLKTINLAKTCGYIFNEKNKDSWFPQDPLIKNCLTNFSKIFCIFPRLYMTSLSYFSLKTMYLKKLGAVYFMGKIRTVTFQRTQTQGVVWQTFAKYFNCCNNITLYYIKINDTW